MGSEEIIGGNSEEIIDTRPGMTVKQDSRHPKTAKDAERESKSSSPISKEALGSLAHFAFRPAALSALIARHFGGIKDDHADFAEMFSELDEQIRLVSLGDLGRPEAMLVAQAHALDAMFSSLALRAHGNIGHNVDVVEMYMKLALRAQSQCRATIETLAAIKNPGAIAFVKQANIGQAVQVNNGTPRPSRTGENDIPPNKLLEATHGERLDAGTASSAGQVNPELATVGAVHRSANRRGKGKV